MCRICNFVSDGTRTKVKYLRNLFWSGNTMTLWRTSTVIGWRAFRTESSNILFSGRESFTLISSGQKSDQVKGLLSKMVGIRWCDPWNGRVQQKDLAEWPCSGHSHVVWFSHLCQLYIDLLWGELDHPGHVDPNTRSILRNSYWQNLFQWLLVNTDYCKEDGKMKVRTFSKFSGPLEAQL